MAPIMLGASTKTLHYGTLQGFAYGLCPNKAGHVSFPRCTITAHLETVYNVLPTREGASRLTTTIHVISYTRTWLNPL